MTLLFLSRLILILLCQTLCGKCPYSEFFWSVSSRIRTEYEEMFRISLYSVRLPENTGQKNSEYRHFSRNEKITIRPQVQVKNKILAQVFPCEFCEIFKDDFFYGTSPLAASDLLSQSLSPWFL